MEHTDKHTDEKSLLYKAVAVLAATAALALVVYMIAEIKSMRYIGAGSTSSNVITVTGKADTDVKPDIALITFTSRSEAKKTADAQDAVKKQVQQAVDALKALGVAEKDIKTTSVNSYPKYSYPTAVCNSYSCPQPKPVLDGYEYIQTNEVKIRKTEITGDVLEALGKLEINELSGPNFTVDDIEKVKDTVRELAIENAKSKAQTLADQLGVDLVRITSFSESSGDYYPRPMYAMSKMMDVSMGSAEGNAADGIMQGENKIESQVTISYEIK